MGRRRKNTQPPVAAKVKAATAGAGAGAVLSQFALWALDGLFFNGAASPDVPDPVVALVTLAVTGALAFGAGYAKAPHPDDIP